MSYFQLILFFLISPFISKSISFNLPEDLSDNIDFYEPEHLMSLYDKETLRQASEYSQKLHSLLVAN